MFSSVRRHVGAFQNNRAGVWDYLVDQLGCAARQDFRTTAVSASHVGLIVHDGCDEFTSLDPAPAMGVSSGDLDGGNRCASSQALSIDGQDPGA